MIRAEVDITHPIAFKDVVETVTGDRLLATAVLREKRQIRTVSGVLPLAGHLPIFLIKTGTSERLKQPRATENSELQSA